jgi:hypothetical protein
MNVDCTLKSENRLDYLYDSQDKNFAYKAAYFPEVKNINTLISCKENDPNPDSGYIYKILGNEEKKASSGHIQAYESLTALQSYFPPSSEDWKNVSSIDCKNRIDTGSKYQTFNQNCVGDWVTTNTNYDTCQWSRKYVITQEKRGSGTECEYEDGKEEINKPLTSSEVREDIPEDQQEKCKANWEYPCGSTYVYKNIDTDKVTRQACNDGVKANASNSKKTLICDRNNCPVTANNLGGGR